MISKLRVGMLLTAVALLVATPSSVFADTASSIKKYSKQLSALPNNGGPNSKVNSLVTKLAKLDPKKASKYYKTGLTKLSNATSTASADATKIALSVNKALKKSGLSASAIKKGQKQITAANLNFVPQPPPTPAS